MTIVHRMGTFFMLLGGGLLALFVLSDMSGQPTCGFLAAGGVLFALGLGLWLRDPVKSGPPPERFRTV